MTVDDRFEVFDNMEGAELVQETFLFQHLNFDETTKLTGAFSSETFEEGQVILEQDSISLALYIIKSGSVKVVKGHDEEERELARLAKGELFGEMSLIEDALTSASVIALEPTELFVLSREDLGSFMDGNSDFSMKIYKAFCHTLSERLRRTTNDLYELELKVEANEG